MAKNASPKVSIIVPVYNVEEYIDSCIGSIVRQTYRDLEIVLVDDKATDKSGEKCDEWANKDSRIVVVHKQKNEGLNMARATGLEASSGDWVSFVDSDDVLCLDYVNDLVQAALKAGVDIAIARNRRFESEDEIPNRELSEGTLVVKNKNDLMRYVFVESPDAYVYMIITWGKLIKRSVLQDMDWNLADARANEDELEAIQYYNSQKNGIVIIKKTLYYYRNNPNSITNSQYANRYKGKVLSRFEWIEKLYKISSTYFGKGVYADELLYHNVMLNLLLLNKDISRGSFKESDYRVFCKNFYPKISPYEKISNKYPLRHEEKRAFQAIREGGDIFSFWTNDRQIVETLRQDNTNLRQELEQIRNSRLWKVRDGYRAHMKRK